MKKFKEAWELAVKIVTTGALVLGGICLLQHIGSTGQSFEDVSFGDGVFLYMLSAAFLIAYALYWAGITSLGMLLLRWPMHWVLRAMVKRVPLRALGAIPADYSLMWSVPIWAFAALAVFFLWIFRSYPKELLECLVIAICQGFVGGLLLLMLRRHRFQDSGISITRDKSDTDVNRPELTRVAASFAAVWIVFPFFAVPGNVSFVDLAFRAARLSKDHAIIHVREPWDKRLALAGMKGSASFMGPEYARFDNVTVRRRSMGSRVVLEVRGGAGKPQFIGIPRDHIEVE